MSKEKKVPTSYEEDIKAMTAAAQTKAMDNEVVPPPTVVSERLSEVDVLGLDLAKSKRQVALAEAKTALANNENAELNYKYFVLQLYMRYGLTAADAISEAGDIIRGGAVQKPQGQ